MNKETNIYSFADECYVFYGDYKKDIEERDKKIERLNNIINECSDDILKEIKENHHLSYGVALSIRNKLLDYKELKEDK